MFRFKKFSVDDSDCGMKIGVDGVLLGAWIQHNFPKTILDVGTGSGLIALMLAQKFPEAAIHAVEIEAEAAAQAVNNFSASPFGNNFNVLEDDYLKAELAENSFDIIVSNLPYFSDGGIFDSHKRDKARSSKHLPLKHFVKKSANLLNDYGAMYFIYPSTDVKNIIELADQENLHVNTIINIQGNQNSKVKRCLFKLSKSYSPNPERRIQHLVIEINRGEYTAAYKELCKDFYLKF